MIALLQRVCSAGVVVEQRTVAQINNGIVAMIGIEKADTHDKAQRLLQRVLGYRIFADDQGKMNLGLKDVRGDLLLVPQFTLAADTRKGMRPSFSSAAPPEQSRQQFSDLCEMAIEIYPLVQTGVFAADMQVSLVNDGPVTFWISV